MHLSWCSLTYGTIYIDLSKSNKCEMKYFHGAYVKRQQCLLCVWRTIRHGCGISSVSIVEHGYQGIIRESKGREVNRVARSTRRKKTGHTSPLSPPISFPFFPSKTGHLESGAQMSCSCQHNRTTVVRITT